jgi:hypothetical protein
MIKFEDILMMIVGGAGGLLAKGIWTGIGRININAFDFTGIVRKEGFKG